MENKNDIKIFLVDDDAFSLNLYEQNLRNYGYANLNTFSSGFECLDHLSENPGLIFLDHNMNNLTGFETLKKIKRVDPNIYVVIVSAQEDMKTAVNSLKYGAFDYIIKGDNEPEKMKSVVERIHALNDELKRSDPTLIQKLLSIF